MRAWPIAHVVTWIAILFVARRVGRFLVRTESLFWMGLGVTEATAGLFVLSVVIVPLVVYLHAHLYWRDKLPWWRMSVSGR